MSEIAPLIRIFLYIASTWLVARGVPTEVARMISSDPLLGELVIQGVGALAGVAAFVWWRIAKRFGWTT